MEVVDSLKIATDATPLVLQTYNSVLIISVLIMHISFILFLFIFYRITRNKQTPKVFLPLLISLAVLVYPIFSGLNLWPINGLPQLSFPYDLKFDGNHTAFDTFSLIYWEWVPYAITMIYSVLVVFFIQHLYKQNYFSKSQRFLLFVPFINHFLIAKYFLQMNISVLKKSICILFILVSCIHWFYRTIGLVLLLYGVDTYGWYYNVAFGTSVEYPMDGSSSHYTLFSDYLFHFNMSFTFVCTLFMFPVYFILNKLKIVLEVEKNIA